MHLESCIDYSSLFHEDLPVVDFWWNRQSQSLRNELIKSILQFTILNILFSQVGDQILQIDDQNAENMSHAEAVNTIRNCSEQTTLLIRRPLLDEPMGE